MSTPSISVFITFIEFFIRFCNLFVFLLFQQPFEVFLMLVNQMLPRILILDFLHIPIREVLLMQCTDILYVIQHLCHLLCIWIVQRVLLQHGTIKEVIMSKDKTF